MLSRTDAMSCGVVASTFTLPNHDGTVRVLILRCIVSGMSSAVLMERVVSKSAVARQKRHIDLWFRKDDCQIITFTVNNLSNGGIIYQLNYQCCRKFHVMLFLCETLDKGSDVE